MFVGYAVYRLDDGDSRSTLDHRYLRTHAAHARSPAFINLREVCGHHSLEAGEYVVIPSTFEPNFEGDFILRVYSETEKTAG